MISKKQDQEVANLELLYVLEKIGIEIRALRIRHGKKNYMSFAKDELGMNKNTYLRIENGEGDYTIGKLIHILSYYPDERLSDILRKAGL